MLMKLYVAQLSFPGYTVIRFTIEDSKSKCECNKCRGILHLLKGIIMLLWRERSGGGVVQ